MFDIGFWELALIGVIALLVVGPERLPGLARTVGLWVGRVRRYVAHVKADIEREIHAEEVRGLMKGPSGLEELRDVARETASVLDDTRRELAAAEQSAAEDAPETPREATPGSVAPARPTSDSAQDAASLAQDASSSTTASRGGADPGAVPSAAEQTVPDHEQRTERQGQP